MRARADRPWGGTADDHAARSSGCRSRSDRRARRYRRCIRHRRSAEFRAGQEHAGRGGAGCRGYDRATRDAGDRAGRSIAPSPGLDRHFADSARRRSGSATTGAQHSPFSDRNQMAASVAQMTDDTRAVANHSAAEQERSDKNVFPANSSPSRQAMPCAIFGFADARRFCGLAIAAAGLVLAVMPAPPSPRRPAIRQRPRYQCRHPKLCRRA